MNPWRSMATDAYSEQVGKYRQFAPKKGDTTR
jgi:hypothetical protein